MMVTEILQNTAREMVQRVKAGLDLFILAPLPPSAKNTGISYLALLELKLLAG